MKTKRVAARCTPFNKIVLHRIDRARVCSWRLSLSNARRMHLPSMRHACTASWQKRQKVLSICLFLLMLLFYRISILSSKVTHREYTQVHSASNAHTLLDPGDDSSHMPSFMQAATNLMPSARTKKNFFETDPKKLRLPTSLGVHFLRDLKGKRKSETTKIAKLARVSA